MNQIGTKLRGFFNTRLGFLALAIVILGKDVLGISSQI